MYRRKREAIADENQEYLLCDYVCDLLDSIVTRQLQTLSNARMTHVWASCDAEVLLSEIPTLKAVDLT